MSTLEWASLLSKTSFPLVEVLSLIYTKKSVKDVVVEVVEFRGEALLEEPQAPTFHSLNFSG